MAFGMTLGTQAGMGTAGVPPRPRPRNSVQMHGSSLRAGGRSYAGIPGGGGGVMTDDDAARARQTAERAAAANARASRAQSAGAGSIPEQEPMKTSADVQKEFDEGVGKLPGGTMGASPDFTERNQYLKRLEEIEKEMIDNETRRAANPFSELLGIGKKEERILQMRHAATMNQARRAHQFATEGATASAAKAAEERAANTWVPTKSTLPSGQVVQANALTGETRPAFVQTKKEEYDWGPEIGGSTTFTTEEPEMDQTIVEKNRQAAIDAQKAKAAEEQAKRLGEIAFGQTKELRNLESTLKRGDTAAEIAGRKAAGAYDHGGGDGGRQADPLAVQEKLDKLIESQVRRAYGDPAGLADDVRAKAYAEAEAAVAKRLGLDVASSTPEISEKGRALVLALKPGQKIIDDDGNAWVNDSGTPKMIGKQAAPAGAKPKEEAKPVASGKPAAVTPARRDALAGKKPAERPAPAATGRRDVKGMAKSLLEAARERARKLGITVLDEWAPWGG